jgi:hypothetical protein
MGFVMETGDDRLPEMYNVIYAVGQNAANYFKDVKLVQYCLQGIYATGQYPAPKGTMTVDGVCGPTTRAWIKAFQNEMISQGWCMSPDGRVDRAPADPNAHNVTHTITMLNYELQRLNPNAWVMLPARIAISSGTPSGAAPQPRVTPAGGA